MNMPSYLPHGPYIRSCLAVTFGGDSVAHLGSATTLCHLPWYCRWFDPALALTVFIPHNTVSIPKPRFVSSLYQSSHPLMLVMLLSKAQRNILLQQININTIYLSYIWHPLLGEAWVVQPASVYNQVPASPIPSVVRSRLGTWDFYLYVIRYWAKRIHWLAVFSRFPASLYVPC